MQLMFCQAGFGWRPQLDNPNFTGWSVVVFYELAALACARAAVVASSRRSLQAPDRKGPGRAGIWWGLALALCFLGINKQLNLQTLLIVIGRHLAADGGWYGQRRMAQWVFNVTFGLGLGLLLVWLKIRHSAFFRQNRCILWGLLILALFVVLRSSTINHANPFLVLSRTDKNWAWTLEIAGSILIAIGAIQARSCSET